MHSADLRDRGYMNPRVAADDGRMVVAHETNFIGMPTQTFSNGGSYLLPDGILYGAALSGGATAEINANGLKTTFPTSGEISFYTSSSTLFADKIGRGRLRRGSFALWVHIHSYAFASTAWAYAVAVGGANYSAHCWGTRRTRNLQGAPNNATGSLGMWSAWNGSDVSGAFAGAPDTVGNGSTSHNGTEDVVCMYWRSPTDCTWYYGSYADGWPVFETMKFGATHDLRDVRTTVFNKWRDPASTWGLAFASGSGGNSNSNNMTVSRWRMTYWKD